MRSRLLLVLFLLLLPMSASALEIVERELPAVKGAQIFVLRQEPDIFFKGLKEKGVNTVFFRVFHNKSDRTHLGLPNPCPNGGVYFSNTIACTVDDLLPSIIKAAHENEIAVYAWMATRSLSFLKTSENMSLAFAPKGTIPGYGASLFKTDVRTKLTELFSELAFTGIDGILIQDDFIMKYAEGAEKEACESFEKSTGRPCASASFFKEQTANGRLIPMEPEHSQWSAWKANELVTFFTELRKTVRLANPRAKWAINIYYETPVYPDKGLAWYSHDLEKIIGAGADYLAIMAYQEQIVSELGLDSKGLLDYADKLATGALEATDTPQRVIFKLQIKPFYGGRINAKDHNSLFEKLQSTGAVSFALLPVESPKDIEGFK